MAYIATRDGPKEVRARRRFGALIVTPRYVGGHTPWAEESYAVTHARSGIAVFSGLTFRHACRIAERFGAHALVDDIDRDIGCRQAFGADFRAYMRGAAGLPSEA